MFVGDYRPTKRVGIEELDGALRILRDRIDQAYADANARQHFYEGAWLALGTLSGSDSSSIPGTSWRYSRTTWTLIREG